MRQYFEGDMNLYGYGKGEAGLPEKTKQMGALDEEKRIYIEDYVYTYLYQYGKSGGGKEKIAALVGRCLDIDGEESIIISGAIQGKGTVQKNGIVCFGEETWEYIGSQMELYFKGMTLVGWVHVQPGFGSFLMAKDEIFHGEYFKEPWQVLFVLDTLDKMDTFYVYNGEKKGLRQARGYFIYYDKNMEMQEYMLENSMIKPKEAESSTQEVQEEEHRTRRRKPLPEERIDAAKEIRKVLQRRAKEAEEAQKGRYAMLTGVSCVLCVVCLCMGFGLMSNMNRLRSLEGEIISVRSSYQELEENFEGMKVRAAFAAETKKEDEKVETKEVKEEPKKAEMQKYTVEAGDNLRYISSHFYGHHGGVTKIMEANGLENADMIFEGQELLIP